MSYIFSHVGKKQLMAVTGLIWSLFVMSHMMGNLLIFQGADAYNSYAHFLISNPLIYLAEGALALTLLVHVIDGVSLKWRAKKARPIVPKMTPSGEKAARFQSRFMIFHGSLILVFIIHHLITFKFGPVYMTTIDGVEMRDLYRLVVEVFQDPFYVGWYTLCMVGVGLHLAHGFQSSFSSLGFYHPDYSLWIRRFGYVYAFIVALGFIAQPLFVFWVY